MATLFPRHFYLGSKHDPMAILGAMPISCYTTETHPHGFASTLQYTRTLMTHSSSSTSTCPITTCFLYDVQANSALSNVDSPLVSRHGFKVDNTSQYGLSVQDKKQTDLTESVDSHQAALDLAGSQPYVSFDLFLTFTCNQKLHPGIKHLHEWKESMEWTKHIPRYEMMAPFEQAEVKSLFEQAYALIMSRCWFEVRKIWLDYITYSTNSILHKVAHVFWRDKFQEKCGNLPHIHGLVALDKTDMENEELLKLLFSLQKCGVMDMFSTKPEDMQNYIDLGLFKSETDWFMHTYLGQKILGHRCSPRCKVRISDGDGPECFRCRKIDPVLGSNNPLEQEFIPLHYKFSNECLSVLEECSLYEPPGEHQLYGMFHHSMFTPSRHMGICNPSDRHSISPANDIWFAATKSMQNFQILTGTNGVARYVVKYVT